MYSGYQDINRRFRAIDENPVILDAEFDGVLAWGGVKERVWLWAMTATTSPSRKAGHATGAGRRVAEIAARLLAEGWNCLLGAAVTFHMLLSLRQARIGLIYDRRQGPAIADEKSACHPILGSLARLQTHGVLHIFWGRYGKAALWPRHNCIDDYPVNRFIALCALAMRGWPGIRKVARTLAGPIAEELSVSERSGLERMIADQLARFRLRRTLFRRVFRRRGIARLVVLDGDTKAGEIAAARDLGIPVLEVQHGMFGRHDPEYAWTARHRSLQYPVPVADHVAVFGPFWKDQLLSNGYWSDADVSEISYPLLLQAHQRPDRPGLSGQDEIVLVHASQPHIRAASVQFWSRFAADFPDMARRMHLMVKMHPNEDRDGIAYLDLQRAWPGRFEIVPGEAGLVPLLPQVDVVTGVSSFALVEAVGLGCAALCLGLDERDESFGSAFAASELDDVIPFCRNGQEMATFLLRLQHDRAKGEAGERQAISKALFSQSTCQLIDLIFPDD